MIAVRPDDDEVARARTTAPGRAESYALPRTPQRRRVVVPITAVGAGLVMGGAGLALLQVL